MALAVRWRGAAGFNFSWAHYGTGTGTPGTEPHWQAASGTAGDPAGPGDAGPNGTRRAQWHWLAGTAGDSEYVNLEPEGLRVKLSDSDRPAQPLTPA